MSFGSCSQVYHDLRSTVHKSCGDLSCFPARTRRWFVCRHIGGWTISGTCQECSTIEFLWSLISSLQLQCPVLIYHPGVIKRAHQLHAEDAFSSFSFTCASLLIFNPPRKAGILSATVGEQIGISERLAKMVSGNGHIISQVSVGNGLMYIHMLIIIHTRKDSISDCFFIVAQTTSLSPSST